MAKDLRAALDRVLTAFEAHLDVVETTQDEDDPAVLHAAATLADAFEAYDELLYDEYGVDTPFIVYDGDEDDLEDDDLDEDEAGDVDDDDAYDDDLDVDDGAGRS
ncbi:DNA primase [Ruania halotolerans]|uniref:DNA primase n=1 Tax=Ruania halotolerans TaxID=2897773 RepID=UPI001E3D11BC|nr:DNA primase [Ruania halotolerans]UFU08071.1 DNA primase [Ruania halotolerans]